MNSMLNILGYFCLCKIYYIMLFKIINMILFGYFESLAPT